MYLTTKEAAEKLNIKIRQVQALIENGRLPAERFGRAYMLKAEDVEKEMLNERKKTGRPKKITESK